MYIENTEFERCEICQREYPADIVNNSTFYIVEGVRMCANCADLIYFNKIMIILMRWNPNSFQYSERFKRELSSILNSHEDFTMEDFSYMFQYVDNHQFIAEFNPAYGIKWIFEQYGNLSKSKRKQSLLIKKHNKEAITRQIEFLENSDNDSVYQPSQYKLNDLLKRERELETLKRLKECRER